MRLPPKSAFCSLTMLSNGVVVAALALLAVSEPATRMLVRSGFLSAQDAEDVVEIVRNLGVLAGLGGTGGVAAGRLRVGDLFTPKGLPGPNADELYTAYLNSVVSGERSVIPEDEPVEELPFRI